MATLGLGAASAASLGVVSTSLAAGSAAVTSCQNQAPVTAALVSQPTGSGFTTTAVDLSGINPNCVGQQYRLSVIGASGPIVEVTGQVPSTAFRTGSFPAVGTRSIVRVDVVMHS
ncbi:hypothetical protein N867_19540 [Actinotalea fermentans ATCC 43279 = JCM 9966 = DSM 3133]|nr:hypothetical protein N867_19540 [Actinotalea fermentans ATCC 43279 = JCM 9966 = DSM 3133]